MAITHTGPNDSIAMMPAAQISRLVAHLVLSKKQHHCSLATSNKPLYLHI